MPGPITPRRRQSSLTAGIAAALASGGAPTVQVVASDGACFELDAGTAKQADPTLFDASAP